MCIISIKNFEEHRTTSRIVEILELLSNAAPSGYTLTEIAGKLNAPKSSLFPIVHTLHMRRFLQQDISTGCYSIGIAAFAVGSAFDSHHSLLGFIKNEMHCVAENCSEICQLGVPDLNQVLYVAKEDSPNPIQLISHVGMRLPMYATALGKAILMCYSYNQLIDIYPDSSGMTALTESTVTDRDQLFRQLEEMHRSGYAMEYGESNANICCIAVPLKVGSDPVAAISVSIPSFRCNEEKLALVRENLAIAKRNIESLIQKKDVKQELERLICMQQ